MTHARRDTELWAIGLLLFVGARAINWLITPMRHPDSSELQQWAAVAQAVIGGGAAVILIRRRGARTRRGRSPKVP
jgi:hypothetical protein